MAVGEALVKDMGRPVQPTGATEERPLEYAPGPVVGHDLNAHERAGARARAHARHALGKGGGEGGGHAPYGETVWSAPPPAPPASVRSQWRSRASAALQAPPSPFPCLTQLPSRPYYFGACLRLI